MLVFRASLQGLRQVDALDREAFTAGMAKMLNHCFEAAQGPANGIWAAQKIAQRFRQRIPANPGQCPIPAWAPSPCGSVRTPLQTSDYSSYAEEQRCEQRLSGGECLEFQQQPFFDGSLRDLPWHAPQSFGLAQRDAVRVRGLSGQGNR
jgi:hypothetical protein